MFEGLPIVKVGLQTISWGPRLENLEAIVKWAPSAGYAGLEFAQHPDELGDPAYLRDMLSSHELCPVGLSGGPLRSRIPYAEVLHPEYLYSDEWDDEFIRLAVSRSLRVGLHPHFYKDFETLESAAEYLNKIRGVGLIADVAHQALAGEDIPAALDRHAESLIAVHLKDWTSRFGLSPFRFAEGFTALGDGDLGEVLDAVVAHLRASEFPGWVIVEQNVPDRDPFVAAANSREWLKQRGI